MPEYQAIARLSERDYDAQKNIVLLNLQIGKVDDAQSTLATASGLAPDAEKPMWQNIQAAINSQKAGQIDQAVKSAQVSYDSTRLGLEVGVRTNLDVLNQQQQVFQTRFNLAQSYYNFVINGLRLKQAVGTLSDADIEEINRALGG